MSEPGQRSRLYRAFAVYALIAVLATFTLDGKFRIAIWILIAGLALRTWLAWIQQQR